MGDTMYATAVTVSATYGAGGSIIAPRLAVELRVPFIDRFLSPEPERQSTRDPHSEEGLSEQEQAATPAGRFLSYFARAATVGAIVAPDPVIEDDITIRERTEADLREVAAGSPAVVLGRAGAVVLASRPRTFHVRLDGPLDRRLKWATQFEHLDEESVGRRQSEADRARSQFVKRLYHIDPADPSLYHLVLDTTVLGVDRALVVIATAAKLYFEANP